MVTETKTGWTDSRVWMVASLVIVCLVSALGLSQVYLVTKPQIEKQKADAVNQALGQVLPNAASFEEKEDGLWYGLDSAGNRVGIVFRCDPRGYAGPVETMVGVDLEARVTGIRIASPAEGMKETPGLGLKARDDWFRDQFKGLTADQVRLKKDGGTLDAISAATITSRAVAAGVADGIRKYAPRLKTDDAPEPDAKEDTAPEREGMR
ncbi:MAG: RnfABCDGE type electron transport complex subunit G [candidate division WOR-3 bacterium]|nr:MAG: RnfABCDGE type electron transport complex subunit G [candidate division WOR-3 bacterium]